ncbi:hypothetical protein WME79_35205 [Sorangium sp. So ce726]|uniref:hypothetical protein n=1 Tax=Sorangium sp. So ce726 TaxID=3133319 RepID=UPI003F63386A
MRASRTLVSVALVSLLSLSAAAAQADVTIDDVLASDGTSAPSRELVVVGDTLHLRVHVVSSCEGIDRVEAELEGVTVELTPTGDNFYEGTFDISELAYGPRPLTIRAYDLVGNGSTVERTVERTAAPYLWLSSPRMRSVVGSSTPLDARCSAVPPRSCQSLCVEVRGRTHTASACNVRTASSPPDPLKLLARPFTEFESGEELTITLSGNNGVGPDVTTTLGPFYVEQNPALTAVQRAPGAILDFDAERILFLDPDYLLGVLDRGTQRVTWLATLPPDPPGSSPTYGALTPSGAVVQSGTSRIFTSVDGVWTRISRGRLDAVNADSLVWTTDDEDRAYLHTIATGLNQSIWNRPGSESPFQADIAASGDVYYGTYEEPWIRRLLTGRLGNHPGDLQRPITDGTNVAGRWSNGDTSSSYLYTAAGEEVFLGDSISGNSAGLVLHAGHAGFLMSDGEVNQVWLRTSDGELHQVSDFTTSSLFDQQNLRVGHDGISDEGEVLFLNEGKRYIGRPGAAPEEIGSDLGHGRWFDGSWYVTVGDTLFQVAREGAAVAGLRGVALRAAPEDTMDGYQEVVVSPIAGAALERPMRLNRLEPDAMPDLSEIDEATDLAGDASSDGASAAAGCSAGGSAGPGSGAAAFAAFVGLALARRRR